MTIQSNHHDPWIYGSVEDAVLLLAIIAIVLLPTVFALFYE